MRNIEVVAYQTEWKDLFEKEKLLLEQHLKDLSIEVYHIGSTSVPQLSAKPIIDIMITLEDTSQLDAYAHEFEKMGYVCKGEFGIAGRRFYLKGIDHRTHHIHAFDFMHQKDIDRHLAVRDYLRTHPSECRKYAQVKKEAASICKNDIGVYCDYKDAFVKELERKALDWFYLQQDHNGSKPSSFDLL